MGLLGSVAVVLKVGLEGLDTVQSVPRTRRTRKILKRVFILGGRLAARLRSTDKKTW